jgi:hypothetical protein
MRSGFLVMMMPRPWLPELGLKIHVEEFFDFSVESLNLSKSSGINHVSGKKPYSSSYFFFIFAIFFDRKCLFPSWKDPGK